MNIVISNVIEFVFTGIICSAYIFFVSTIFLNNFVTSECNMYKYLHKYKMYSQFLVLMCQRNIFRYSFVECTRGEHNKLYHKRVRCNSL